MWYVCARRFLRPLVFSCIFLAEYSAVASQESPQSFTFQGQLLNSAGTAPATGTIGLTLDIYDPSGQCLLYEESQSGIDLTSSQGLFSVAVGSATTGPSAAKRTTNDPTLSMAQVFANSGAQTRASGSLNCTLGYTPAPGDARDLKVTILPQGGSPITLSPDQVIDSAPQANVAETVQGIGPTGFVQISGNTGAYTAAKAGLDALLGTGTSGVVDASAYHNHDGRYVQIGSTPQNVGSGGWYTSGVGGTGVSAAPTGTQFEVMSSGTTTVGEIIKAGASQTGDLLDIESNSGSVLASVNSSGQMSLNDGLQLAAGTYLGLGTFASPPGSCSTAGQIWYAGGSIQYCNGSAVETLGTSGAGLQSLNGQTGNTQTFATPTTAGTSFGFSSASNVHTLNIPLAATSTVTAGLLSNTDYTSFQGKVGGGASLSHAGALTQVSGSGTVTEASGLSYGQTANITNLIVTAGSSQSTNDLEDWKSSGGASTLYSLNSSGTPTANTDLATKNYVATAISGVGSSYVPLGGGTMTGPLVIPANDLTVGTTQLVLSGGNVGIGTTSPGAQLDVTGSSGIAVHGSNNGTLNVFGAGSAGGLSLISWNSSNLGTIASAGSLNLNGDSYNSGGANINFNFFSGTAVMTIQESGNVGIGTTSPSTALQVGDSVTTASPQNIFVGNAENGTGFASYVGNWNSTGYWGIGALINATNDNTLRIGNVSTAGGGWAGTQNLNLVIGGNVGIGTTSPAGTLDVEGGTAAGSGVTGSNINIVAQNGSSTGNDFGGAINITSGSAHGNGQGGPINFNLGGGGAEPENLNLYYSVSSTYSPTSSSSGYPTQTGFLVQNNSLTNGTMATIELGPNNSAGKQAWGYFGAVSSSTNYVPALVWGQQTGSNSYAERMRIDTTGNVGIGTTAPGAGLDVSLAGAASTPGEQIDGAWYTSGTGATNTPQLLVQPSGTSSSTWSTHGTGLGVNAVLGFNGNLLDLQVNGTSVFAVSSTGTITGTISNGSVDWAAPSAIGSGTPAAGTFTALASTGYAQSSGNFAMSGTGTLTTGTGNVSLNGATTVAANQNLTMASGTGQFSQTYTGTANAATITANSLGVGNAALTVGSSSTAAGIVTGISSSLTGAATTNVAGYFSATGATNNYGLLVPNGYVGIGTTAPTSTLQVNGAITSSVVSNSSSNTVDFSTGNVQYMTSASLSNQLLVKNMASGGAYTIVIEGTTASQTYTFTQASGTQCTSALYNPAQGATTAGTQSVFTLLYVSGACYISWMSGFQTGT